MRKFDEKVEKNIVSVLLNWSGKTRKMEGKPLETGGFSLAAARKAEDGIDCSELYVLHNKSVIHITGHTPIAPGAAAQEMGSTPGA